MLSDASIVHWLFICHLISVGLCVEWSAVTHITIREHPHYVHPLHTTLHSQTTATVTTTLRITSHTHIHTLPYSHARPLSPHLASSIAYFCTPIFLPHSISPQQAVLLYPRSRIDPSLIPLHSHTHASLPARKHRWSECSRMQPSSGMSVLRGRRCFRGRSGKASYQRRSPPTPARRLL